MRILSSRRGDCRWQRAASRASPQAPRRAWTRQALSRERLPRSAWGGRGGSFPGDGRSPARRNCPPIRTRIAERTARHPLGSVDLAGSAFCVDVHIQAKSCCRRKSRSSPRHEVPRMGLRSTDEGPGDMDWKRLHLLRNQIRSDICFSLMTLRRAAFLAVAD